MTAKVSCTVNYSFLRHSDSVLQWIAKLWNGKKGKVNYPLCHCLASQTAIPLPLTDILLHTVICTVQTVALDHSNRLVLTRLSLMDRY